MDDKEKLEQGVNKRDYEDELLEIIRSEKEPAEIRRLLSSYHDNDIASVFPKLTDDERRKLYRILDDEEISDIFSYLDDVEQYISELDAEKAADIIESMDADDAVDVLNELDDSAKLEIIELMDDDAAKDVLLIDSYDEDMVGSMMTTNYVSVASDSSVKQAMRDVIAQAAENDNISTIYVTDADKYAGAIDLRDLVMARQGTPLSEITQTSFPFVYARETLSDCIDRLKDYSEDSIPVLNKEGKLIGAITGSALVEAVDDEMSEDYARLAGLTDEEEFDEPIVKSVKKRLPWLVILLFLGLCVSTVVGAFEGVIDQLAYLVLFQSLILGMSGNVGTQSLAVTIRIISDNEMTGKNTAKLALKETRVGLFDGLIIGTVAFAGSFIYLLFSKAVVVALLSATCIGCSMVVAMTLSSLTGCMIPVLFKKIGVDPAVASGPLITTINDMVAVCTYYGLAAALLLSIV